MILSSVLFSVNKLSKKPNLVLSIFSRNALCFIFFFTLVEVEPQYTGARIEGDVVTLDFVKKMMEDFKSQKNLHRRC